MLISPAYAQAATGGGDAFLIQMMPLVLIFVVFYFLLIRPQQQKARVHREMIEALKKGDQVVTAGGIIGKVARVEADGTLMVEIAQGVQVKVTRGTIADLYGKPPPVTPSGTNDNKAKGMGAMFGRLFKK